MKLFHRLLSSLFPQAFQGHPTNPIGMFVGLVSSKQFFSVVYRRIVEPYRLNGFDLSLESQELKLGIGNAVDFTQTDIDNYFSYGSVAQFNGRVNISPTNISTIATMVSCFVLRDALKEYNYKYVTSLFITIHLFTYVMIARVKVMPNTGDLTEDYDRFIKTFFGFYQIVLKKRGVEIDKEQITEIKNMALQKIHLFFFLFYFYRRVNTLYSQSVQTDYGFYNWFFADELSSSRLKESVTSFITHAVDGATTKTRFSLLENKIIDFVFPVELQIRYLFDEKNRYSVTDILLGELFQDIALEELLLPFLKSDDQLDEFLAGFLDRALYKKNYFGGAKKLAQRLFRDKQSYEISKEIDEFMSTIEETGSVDGVKVPEQLKQESKMMDRLMNFYLTFVAGFSIGRGDNFYLRLSKPEFINNLVSLTGVPKTLDELDQIQLQYIEHYKCTVPFYKATLTSVRAGKQYQKTSTHLNKNVSVFGPHLIRLSLYSDRAVLFQDCNKKAITLSVANKNIITLFKNQFGEVIGSTLLLDDNDFLKKIYQPFLSLSGVETALEELIHDALGSADIDAIKENLYTLDFWLWRDFLVQLQQDTILSHYFYTGAMVKICAMIRETLFGLLLLYSYRRSFFGEDDKVLGILTGVYISEILLIGRDKALIQLLVGAIEKIYHRYKSIFDLRIKLDDNEEYFSLILKEIEKLQLPKENEQQINKNDIYLLRDSIHIECEDAVWLRGVCKTITYYNKRYLIPHNK